MYYSAIIGIKSNYKYVVVSDLNGVLKVEYLGREDIENRFIGSIYLKGSKVDVAGETRVSKRVIRALLAAFEKDLCLLEGDIEVLKLNDTEDGLEVNVKLKPVSFALKDYIGLDFYPTKETDFIVKLGKVVL